MMWRAWVLLVMGMLLLTGCFQSAAEDVAPTPVGQQPSTAMPTNVTQPIKIGVILLGSPEHYGWSEILITSDSYMEWSLRGNPITFYVASTPERVQAGIDTLIAQHTYFIFLADDIPAATRSQVIGIYPDVFFPTFSTRAEVDRFVAAIANSQREF